MLICYRWFASWLRPRFSLRTAAQLTGYKADLAKLDLHLFTPDNLFSRIKDQKNRDLAFLGKREALPDWRRHHVGLQGQRFLLLRFA